MSTVVPTTAFLPPELQAALADPAMAMTLVVAGMRCLVQAKVPNNAPFRERELAYLRIANEICGVLMKQDLEMVAASQGVKLLIDGKLHKRHQEGTGSYHSLCGSMKISRWTYRIVGQHSGPTVVPLDLEVGMIHHATPALAFAIASGCADAPDRQCEEQLRAAQRQPPSRSTIERIAKEIGTDAKKATPRIEVVVRAKEALPDKVHAISIGLDRTAVPMEEERPKEAPLPTGRKKRSKPYVRAIPPRIDVNYRMAYVGTVSVVDAHGDSLVARRYAASAEEGPDAILDQMMADVGQARAERPDIPVGITQDGAPEMWNLTRSALQDKLGIQASHEAIDRYHFNERTASILRIVEPDSSQRALEKEQWKKRFDNDDDAIDAFANFLNKQMVTHADDENFDILEDNWTFILNNNDRLRYASVRNAGLPEGSGATEGACKSLVAVRAKRSSQRWHTDGLDAILTLRSIKMSERLPTFWALFADDFTAEVRAAA